MQGLSRLLKGWTERPFVSLEFIYFIFICFWLFWVFIAVCRLSLTADSRGYSLPVGARTAHHSGFSSCGAWALGAGASVVVAHRLSCSWHVASSWTRDWTRVHPALAGGFLASVPPEQSSFEFFWWTNCSHNSCEGTCLLFWTRLKIRDCYFWLYVALTLNSYSLRDALFRRKTKCKKLAFSKVKEKNCIPS